MARNQGDRLAVRAHMPAVRPTIVLALLAVAVLGGCSDAVTTPSATPQAAVFLPLPPGIIIEPNLDSPSASVSAASPGGAAAGVVYRYELGHCGLGSPVDFDGSLWDAEGALDRLGGPVDDDREVGELLNATAGEIVLVDGDHAQFRTPLGTVVGLTRHDGAKEVSLCD